MNKLIFTLILLFYNVCFLTAKTYDVIETTTYYGYQDTNGITAIPEGWTVSYGNLGITIEYKDDVVLNFLFTGQPSTKGNIINRAAIETSSNLTYNISITTDKDGNTIIRWSIDNGMQFFFKLKEQK